MSTPESPNHVPPVPRYGEYAPVTPNQPPAPLQPYGAPSYYAPTGERPPRTADMVVSIVLLGIGFISVLIAILNAFTITYQMDEIYSQYGIEGQYEPGAGAAIATAVIILSHLVLYVLAVVFTILLIRKRRISWWLPLSAGALASVIFMGTFVALVFSDSALLDEVMRQSGQ